MILLGLGIALLASGLFVGADEWRRSGSQHARVTGQGLRVELAALSAVLIGVGTAVAYAGVSA